MISPMLQGISETLVAGILVCIAGGIPIAFFTWAALRVWGSHSSGARFAALYSALIAISLLPLVEGIREKSVSASMNTGPSGSLITVSSSWAVFIFSVWIIFAAVALLRVITGLVKLRRLRGNCRSVHFAGLDPILQQTLGELGCERGVDLCISDELNVPTAIGFFKPLVILPTWALNDLSASQLRPVLLHELAHVRRWDDWTNLLQRVIQAILFFHPAVWWIERRISLEREMACDDIVLAHTGNPRGYAESLLSVAERSFVRRGFSLAQAAVSRMRQTSARIAQILDGNRKSTSRTWKPASLMVAASFVLGFVMLPRVSSLVTFKNEAPVGLTAANVNSTARAPEHSMRITAANASFPRGVVHTASFKTKRSVSSAKTANQNIAGNNVLEAKFNGNESYGPPLQNKNTAGQRQGLVTQTVLVVTRYQRGAQSPEFWTVHIWQLTVFKPTPSENTLPAKKV